MFVTILQEFGSSGSSMLCRRCSYLHSGEYTANELATLAIARARNIDYFPDAVREHEYAALCG